MAAKGSKLSAEHKAKLSIARKKRIITDETRKKLSEAGKGRKFSQETRDKISKSNTGRKASERTRKKISLAKRNKPHRDCTKGSSHHLYKSGKYTFWNDSRYSSEYRNWRVKVYNRDNFTCCICTKRGGELNAHHILLFSKYPELRLEVDNGITLCASCHKKIRGIEYLFENLFKLIVNSRKEEKFDPIYVEGYNTKNYSSIAKAA